MCVCVSFVLPLCLPAFACFLPVNRDEPWPKNNTQPQLCGDAGAHSTGLMDHAVHRSKVSVGVSAS